jgi:hypothetical protein
VTNPQASRVGDGIVTPPWARWSAYDRDGRLWFYEYLPTINRDDEVWYDTGGEYDHADQGDWTESLRRVSAPAGDAAPEASGGLPGHITYNGRGFYSVRLDNGLIWDYWPSLSGTPADLRAVAADIERRAATDAQRNTKGNDHVR